MAYINPHVEWIYRLAIEWLLPNTKTMPTIILLANKILYPLLMKIDKYNRLEKIKNCNDFFLANYDNDK